jgi:hypothetical protein
MAMCIHATPLPALKSFVWAMFLTMDWNKFFPRINSMIFMNLPMQSQKTVNCAHGSSIATAGVYIIAGSVQAS